MKHPYKQIISNNEIINPSNWTNLFCFQFFSKNLYIAGLQKYFLRMKKRSRRVNVQWTFKRMNRKAGGKARSKRSRPNGGVIVLPLLRTLIQYFAKWAKRYRWSLLAFCLFQLTVTASGQTNFLPPVVDRKTTHLYKKDARVYVQEETVMHLVMENKLLIPEQSFILYQNTPNPFSKETYIKFELLKASEITLTIYDPKGKVLKTYEGDFGKGKNQIKVNGEDLIVHGILYYQVTTPDQILSKKMIFREEQTAALLKD